ncbi:hypothetical protein FRB90_000873 [Tulasnella sp. 427]|nr:hypothetical protein FRB90_000873 [Tulasnella sp. 427]
MRQETLVALRKAFKGLEIASSSIPVAGNFVGAAAKVGLAFVETVQKMDGNEDLAKDLGTQTTRLLTLLQQFNNKSEESFIADRMNDLHGELRDILAEVNEWKAMGRFKKGFSARDHEETLKARQAGLQGILEQMQFLVSVDIQIMTAELRNNERQREIQRLLGVLGNGKYGARGNTLEDAVCLPGTRLAILERVDNWIKDTSSDSRVLWIRGMAGRGKSTIASTVVDNWSSRGSCALFHFRRGQTALNARVVCALARQLATTLSPGVKTAVLNAVRENQDIADKRLDKQFETLLVAPLATLSGHSNPVILVLDALDESEDGKEAIDLIDLLDRHSASLPPNVKFLLTSRPEGPLPNTLDSRNWKKEDLDVEADVSNDIELFVQWRLGRIRTSHRLPENWPQSEEVIRLVEMSQGLFQWARTALGYVQNGSPTDRLRMLLKHPARWSGLDDLYHQILQKAFHNIELDQERTQLLHKVLGTIVVAPVPIQLEVLGEFFGDQEYFDGAKLSDVVQFLRNDLLSDLASLIFIPASSEEALVLMHASIADLLTNKTRCNHRSYHIDSEKQHCLLAGLCLEHMVTSLKRNIGDLSQGLQSCLKASGVVKDKLSTTLRYSCLAWSVHLTKGAQDLPLDSTALVPSSFESFSLEKVLLWLEVMSLIGSIPDAIRMAQDVHQWLLNCQELQKYAVLWDDIRRFVSMFAEPITYGPLHIYTSAIPWCPKETDIWRHYGSHAIVEAVRGGETTWSSNVWSRVVGDVVSTVAFSPDGKRIAVGTLGAIIQLHDRVTGSIIGKPLTYPTDMVNSVSFSPDGKVLASGSRDNKIQLWDIDTGCAIGRPLEGHNDWILSISFSPDGRVLASGSDDQSVRIWDPHTGCVVGQPLKGHSERIRCIAFSPDGKVLASASDDTTIRVWDTVTCEAIVQPLEGHPHPITSIAFSPDGKVLASARANGTVQLWNSQTWTSVGQPLNLHSTCIACISFSPDGKILASGSDDGAIQIQSLYNQKTIGHPLRGHSGQVNSISFSPDGRVLVSGSEDGTIRLWEVNIGDAIDQLPESQPEWMSSVSFWLGGTIFASVSKDSTIQIWDTYTGKVIGRTLEGHPDSVAFITYSCHTMVLASESHDGTLRLWNICTGDPIDRTMKRFDFGTHALGAR